MRRGEDVSFVSNLLEKGKKNERYVKIAIQEWTRSYRSLYFFSSSLLMSRSVPLFSTRFLSLSPLFQFFSRDNIFLNLISTFSTPPILLIMETFGEDGNFWGSPFSETSLPLQTVVSTITYQLGILLAKRGTSITNSISTMVGGDVWKRS